MRRISLFVAAVFAVWSLVPRPALAVDLALVLLNDVSSSMDEEEYEMIKDGYRAAFSDPEVIAAINANIGGVAVAYVEFSGRDDIQLVRGWEMLTGEASARAFGDAVAVTPRTSAGDTALFAGLAGAAQLLRDGDFGTARLVIDIASDHPTDFGRAAAVRDQAVADGITINALPIIGEGAGASDGGKFYSSGGRGVGGIAGFYRSYIIGGPGSFVVEARNYEAFGEALKRKLLLELISSPGRPDAPLVVARVTESD